MGNLIFPPNDSFQGTKYRQNAQLIALDNKKLAVLYI